MALTGLSFRFSDKLGSGFCACGCVGGAGLDCSSAGRLTCMLACLLLRRTPNHNLLSGFGSRCLIQDFLVKTRYMLETQVQRQCQTERCESNESKTGTPGSIGGPSLLRSLGAKPDQGALNRKQALRAGQDYNISPYSRHRRSTSKSRICTT